MALTKVTTGGIKDGTITNEDISTTTSISQDKLAAKPGASSSASGLMIPADKNKLDGVADNANNYSHPSAHTVSEVTGLQGLLDGKTTETYVNTQITNVVGVAPAALDTLNELAAALGDDANFAATVTTALAGKVDDSQVLTNVPSGALFTDTNTTYSVGDGGLTQVNFTTADNTKLDGIETGANVTDTANVTAAGALMDSEVTNLAQVKAFDTTDYATSTQGTTADNALPKAGGTMTGALTNRYSEIVERSYGSTIPRLVTTAGNPGNVSGQASPFTSGWSMAYTTSNTHVESVSSGTVWTSRSASSQELLTLMGHPGVQHFNGNFNIYQVTALRPLNTSGHTFPYQTVKHAGTKGTTTHGAFVKHISGRVPYGWWCNGLVAGGGWQFCKTTQTGTSNMGYANTHPYTATNTDNVPTVLLVALPGSVDRYIDSPTEWSLFST